ncbi:hypothetical protein GA830_14085 [Mesorhizobium sp. NBSH29]|uniref:lytic polysaccharide monooxygenase n=1 Tax=Mesorhizobium sp. NBSH29 TaxID=2654249 RepID=UPI0018968DF9|nr:lytic polysaccharide monooxygenase [Mesorhizobium sp. NBSH29]QPC87746.1 hypothetical protein GA830_14085 [Mesorhizobium sp. NBSH29]
MLTKTVDSLVPGVAPRHGHVFSPPSRAYLAWLAGNLDEGALNQREAGKFFPKVMGGLPDADAPTDSPSATPPPDGKIASAGQGTGSFLDQPGTDWQKNEIKNGDAFSVSWNYTANHRSRRWNYFLTKENWDPSKPLSREQFEPEPFYVAQLNLQPYWEHTEGLTPVSPTTHSMRLPRRSGYHVLLAVWEVADTGNAFYHVIDLNFTDSGGEKEPTVPEDFRANEVGGDRVGLSWSPSTGNHPIIHYRIARNGAIIVETSATELNWIDYGVSPNAHYTYSICSVDSEGNISAPSPAILVKTPAAENGPTPPFNLHSMGQTSTSISLMWGAASSSSPIAEYKLYREGQEIASLSGHELSYVDELLPPSTPFRYFAAARDERGELSIPSNVLSVSTREAESEHNEWVLNTHYLVGDLVTLSSEKGKIWRCILPHTSSTLGWAPATPSGALLWAVEG